MPTGQRAAQVGVLPGIDGLDVLVGLAEERAKISSRQDPFLEGKDEEVLAALLVMVLDSG